VSISSYIEAYSALLLFKLFDEGSSFLSLLIVELFLAKTYIDVPPITPSIAFYF